MAKRSTQGSLGGVFLVTYIGAAVYFLNHTQGFWGTIWGLIQALFWPGFVVYYVLDDLIWSVV